MKVITLTFSLTGNTLIMMNRIEHILLKEGHQLVHFDGLRLIKGLYYSNHPPKDLSQYKQEFCDELKHAEVIGIGSYVHSMNLPPGADKLFSDSYLPTHLFKSIKYAFTCETYGGISSPVPDLLFMLLQRKNKSIKLLGQLSIHTPNCHAIYLPGRNSGDGWIKRELLQVDEFGKTILRNLGTNPVTTITLKPKEVNYPRADVMHDTTRMRLGVVVVRNEACTRCGSCIEVCPYNVLSFRPSTPDEQAEAEETTETTEE